MIKANFNTYASYVTDSLYQWDLNQVLSVTGLNLSVVPEVHFSNANVDRAIVRQATKVNNVLSVGIPNSLLQDALTIRAHIGIYEGDTFKVVELVEIPVTARKRPADYQILDADEEIYSFKALENMVANMISRKDFDANTATLKGRIEAANAKTEAVNARIDNLIANNNDTEGNSELVDVRVDDDGTIHGSAGTAVRKQIAKIKKRFEAKNGVYALPLSFSFVGSSTYGYFESEVFKIPEHGFSARIKEKVEVNFEGVTASINLTIRIGRIVKGTFEIDDDVTARYHFGSGIYSNKTVFIPNIPGYYAVVRFSFISSNGGHCLNNNNYADYESYIDYVKVYTGKINNTSGLLGCTPATIRTNTTSEKFDIEWGMNGLTTKYSTVASPLPLKYVKSVTVDPTLWIGAKIYKYDPVSNTTEWVETLSFTNRNPCYGSECILDFGRYGDNFFAILICGKVPQSADYESIQFKTYSKGCDNVLALGFDMSEIENGIHVEWSNDMVLTRGLTGVSLPVLKNIQLLKSLKVDTAAARYGRDVSSDYFYLFGQKDFAGIYYGGGYQTGTFFYHVAPVAYYTALLNPNSNAYGECDTSVSGQKYGIVCSNFTSLLHGHSIPRSTFDYRYNDIPEFEQGKFNLAKNLSTVRLFDVLVQGVGETGHAVMVTDLLKIDNTIPFLKVMESATPCTRENIFMLHNGAPYIKDEPDAWYQEAYDYIARALPEYDDTLLDKADWSLPYTTPSKIMCSRGYGSIYLKGINKVFISVDPSVYSFDILLNGVHTGEYLVPNMPFTEQNGYYVIDITDYVSAAGAYEVMDGENECVERFNVIDVDDYSITATVESDELKITTSHNDAVKYVNVVYQCTSGKYAGKTTSMNYPAAFVNGVMTLPTVVSTDDNGDWSLTVSDKWLNRVNVVFNSGVDTNTFIVDGENDKAI